MEKYVGRDVEIVEQADDLTTRTVKATLLVHERRTRLPRGRQ